jgi:hypothetical protein
MRLVAPLLTVLVLWNAPLRAQSIRGLLLDAESGAVISAATMVLLTEDSVAVGNVVTDPGGAFLLAAPRPGAYRLQAQRLGYRAATTPPLDLEARDTIEVEFRLSTQAVVLQPLRVVAYSQHPGRVLGGFHERAARGGFGTFITREQIEQRHPVYASDLIRTVPGIQVVPTWWGRAVVLMRGWCVPQIYLDGMRIRTSSIDDLVSPMDLEGIEIYRSAAEAPAELVGPGGACGVLALWTRRGS